jgi:hypothetical protein
MQKPKGGFSIVFILIFLTGATFAQDPSKPNKQQAIAPAAGSYSVAGSGTPGQITKSTGIPGLNSFTVGDSNIYEDKFGKVGIGTRTPTSFYFDALNKDFRYQLSVIGQFAQAIDASEMNDQGLTWCIALTTCNLHASPESQTAASG